jgi:hypothetical protein
MGAVTPFFLFSSKGPHWLANFLEHWALPNRNTSLDPYCKISKNVCIQILTFQFVCMGVELWASWSLLVFMACQKRRKKLQLPHVFLAMCDSYELVHGFDHTFSSFFFFLRRHMIGQFFWNIGALPYRNTSLDPSHKIKINILHFLPTFSVDVHGSRNGANHMT